MSKGDKHAIPPCGTQQEQLESVHPLFSGISLAEPRPSPLVIRHRAGARTESRVSADVDPKTKRIATLHP